MIYTSIENEHIKEIKKLNQKKYRDLNNKFIVLSIDKICFLYPNG